MTTVLAPVAGRVVKLAAVPDPVFSEGMVGPGIAIDPAREPGLALAPIDGEIVKLHPHAYVIRGRDGRGVLVHLGINTVELRGEGFRVLAGKGERVRAGRPVISWDPGLVEAGGRSPVCPVVALDTVPGRVGALVTAGSVRAGDAILAWD